ncbi:MAG TPA: aspartyl protease family protein [Vicinamibacteria bacterium]|nr:aspartyl protease family protein [Vicinamibacteria bacterium]
MRIVALGVLSVALVAASSVAAEPEEIAVSVRGSGAIRVPVRIDGQGPFVFLLDTGASHTTITSDLVDRLRLSVVARARVTTAAGIQERPIARLEHMAIGSASREGLLPSVVSRADLRSMEPGIDGVVGQDFLAAFDYTLDYRRKRLRWSAAGDDDRVRARLPLVQAGGRSLVQVTAEQREVLMVPDSGTNEFVIFERDGRTAVEVDEAVQAFAVSTLVAREFGRGGQLRDLRVGELTLRGRPAVVIAATGPRDVVGDGLLPLHHFSSVSFSNSGSYMLVRN